MACDVPGTLYKYVGLKEDGTVRTEFLENGLFRFTQPRHLDDPVEAKPTLVIDRYSDRDREVARQRMEAAGFSCLSDGEIEGLCLDPFPGNRFDPVSFPGLFPELRTHEERVRAIEEHDQGNARKALLALQEMVNRHLGVFCLTETVTNAPMWERYASKYQGIALGFDTHHPFFRDQLHRIDYSGRIALSVYKGVLHIEGVRIRAGMPPPVGLPMLLRKTRAYSHEREWRMVKRLEDRVNERERTEPPTVCLFRVPADAVRSIILGPKTPRRDRERIRTVQSSDPRWRHADLLEVFVSELDAVESALSVRPYTA